MAKVHSKDTQVFIDDGDVSGASTALSVPLARVLSDRTAFGDAGRLYLPGPSEDTFSLETLFDDDTDGVDEELHGLLGTETVVTLWPKGTAISAIGYGSGVAIAGTYRLTSRVPELVLGAGEINFNQVADRVKSLQAKDASAISATEAGTSIDDSASSSAGIVWYYHVFTVTASGGNAKWTIVAQDSANDSSWADIETPIDISAQGSGRRAVSGTIDRYVRQNRVLDASSGTLISHISYVRL